MKLVRMVTSEDYSDFSIHGLFVVDCEDSAAWLAQRLEEWLALHPDQRGRYHGRTQEFVDWLVLHHGLESIQFEEWHLGSYNTFKIRVSPPPVRVELG
jgi:hypothetical protein